MTNQGNQKIKKRILKKALLSVAVLCISIFVLFLFVQTPLFVKVLAQAFGLNMSVKEVSISPDLEAVVRDLRVDEAGSRGISLFISHASLQGGIDNSLNPVIEKAAIYEPKLAIALGVKEKKFNLSALKKLPPVKFLEIFNGKFQVLTGLDGEIIDLMDINLTMKDFSPQKGGKIYFKFKVNIKSTKGGVASGDGQGEGDFYFTKLTPEPAGNGLIKLTLNNVSFQTLMVQSLSLNILLQIKSGELIVSSESPLFASLIYKTGQRDLVVNDLQFMPHVSYDTKTGNVQVTAKNGKIGRVGGFDAYFHSVFKPGYPWKVSIKTSIINIEKASEIIKPFLQVPYDKWSFQGSGTMQLDMAGDYMDKMLSGRGSVLIEFKDGGFSSPNSDVAAQGVGGKIIMDIKVPSQSERGRVDISSQLTLGEFLWGKYYRDFAGRRAFFSSNMDFQRSLPFQADFSGGFDLFDGGRYSYSGNISPQRWASQITSKDINLQEFYHFIFSDYVKQEFPSLSDLDLQGKAGFEVSLNGENEELFGQGLLVLDKAQFALGDALSGIISLNLPFDFFYPDNGKKNTYPPDPAKTGYLYIESIDSMYSRTRDLSIPLIFSRNTILISGGELIPFQDIPLRLTHLRGERVLSADRSFSLGAIIHGMEIEPFIQKALGIGIPGRFEAEFSDIFYQNKRLSIKGEARVSIFEGSVVADNIHGRDVFSHSRVIGGDIVFEGINLNELTRYIELGRMSGIIVGSLKGLEIEYGQPSKFILDIESVKTKGVTQNVSVDAIENFSIIGAGSQGIGTILKSGLNKFFKDYPYSKMGIMCTLENDVFTLRGKILDGGKEYLIRKGFFRGIDVINQNPENNISFKDMKERINRIFEKARQS